MTAYPIISIITPSFNQGQFLEETIKSVLNQGYPNLEYIIIDGGSTDNSIEVIKKYEETLAYWVSEKDKGQTHAVNKGIAQTHGGIIGWINSDDIYLGQCFLQVKKYFELHPSIDIIFSDYLFIDENNHILKVRKEIPFNYNVYLWTQDCYHANCAGFFRRRVFEKVGELDESLTYGMDYEFYLRCAQAGLKFGHHRGFWGAYRLHGQSKSMSQYKLMNIEGANIANRFYPAGISSFTKWMKRRFYSFYRIGCKFMIGSYSPLIKQRISKAYDGQVIPLN